MSKDTMASKGNREEEGKEIDSRLEKNSSPFSQVAVI